MTEGHSAAISQYTKPEVVRNLTVTKITTSSISVMWIKPEGNGSSYKVHWTDGNVTFEDHVTETNVNISNLTAGVQYDITVTAVADDGMTEGHSAAISQYTKPEVVRNLTVTKITTSSISVKWIKPEGSCSSYKVHWTDGNVTFRDHVTETNVNISNLTAGVQYDITVTAVADDGRTEGHSAAISQYTKPEVVGYISVTKITTSSISVMWIKPEGSCSSYKVHWTDGNVTFRDHVTETNVNISNLTAGVQYDITVTAVADDGRTEGHSAAISQYTKPEVVRNLTVTKITTSSISVMWIKPEGNGSSYKVHWTDGNVTFEDHVTETNVNISNLTAGVQYDITVTAVADDGMTEGHSAAISQYTKPEVVRNLTVGEITTSSISVMWIKPEGNGSSYKVHWTDGNVTFEDHVTETNVNISNLTAGVQYDITVTAVADDGMTEGHSAAISQYTKPEVVRNLTVGEITTSSISVMWIKPEGSCSSYKVHWTDGNVTFRDHVTETNVNISNLTAGVQYDITVTAVADDGRTEGHSAAISQYTKPEVVRNLTVTKITTSSISVMWIKPEGNGSSYKVHWTDGNVTFEDHVTETNVNISNLTAGVQYDITVTAVADDGMTEGHSAAISQYTKPEVVRNLTVTKITTSSISVKWIKPEGSCSSYKVHWTDGNVTFRDHVTETNVNISNLTAGVQYDITVTAVADDGRTEGHSAAISQYTKPEVVGYISVTKITTSSISVMWIKPEGSCSSYKVHWTDGNVTFRDHVTETNVNISNLTAGVQYDITVTAVADDGRTEGHSAAISQYTKPEVVRNLTVGEITTSSISVKWIKPEGSCSSYKVHWTDGNVTFEDHVTETNVNISNLTAGVQYDITVTAVADDGMTEGHSAAISQYTKPEVVRNLTVTKITTSSISVKWIKPEGSCSSYKVHWTDGNVTFRDHVTETNVNISNLTAGVQYDITVTAVADDGMTEGHSAAISQYTKPEVVGYISVTKITTSSISVKWIKPEGSCSSYKVHWTDGNVTFRDHVTETNVNISNLTAGVQYDITVTAVADDGRTEGHSAAISQYTKPEVVRNLTVGEITTSSISVMWIKPEGSSSFYTVKWTDGTTDSTVNATETNINVTELTPGVQYSFTVIAVAGDIKSEVSEIVHYTKPEKPENISVTARGTDYLNISWTLPNGRVDHYVVNITNEIYLYCNVTTVTTVLFTDLNPGRLFFINVIAVSGIFSKMSDQSSFATEPTPPGSIIISQRTNSSLFLQWATPALMEGAPNISYHITYQTDGGEAQNKSPLVNHTELSSLLSGTSYNITVETVGPQSLKSKASHHSAFTLPNPVLNLVASPQSSTSVKVEWSHPQEAPTYYKYLVQTYNSTGALFNTTVSNNSTNVSNLEPGTRYNINVTTIAAAGSESTVEQTFSYTMPKAVTNLTVEDVNTTAIRLTWLRQSDHKPFYSYLVITLQDAMMVQNHSTETETYTFFNLTPGKLYTFDVFTVVEGVRSTVESKLSYTKPGAVSDTTATGSTTNMSVSWTPAFGQVDSYTVLLYRDGQLVENRTDLSNATVNEQFQDLTPGVLYCVVVVTKSGPFETQNLQICNATFPNPPGPIMVDSQTVDSINFTWPFPEGMDQNQYNFSVSIFSSSVLTGNNWFLLDSLQSGSPYSIFVTTVGVLNYESTAVTAESYTRPYPVTMLRETDITTNSVTLEWEQAENKSHYSYVVQTTNGSFSTSETVLNGHIMIPGLLSGSSYSFTVTTQTADDTQAVNVTVSYFTRPYSIGQLEAETLNTTTVRLVWTKPLEYKTEYRYRVETTGCCSESQNKTFAGEVAEISKLTPGTNFTFCVFVMAADGIEGKARRTSQYTKPETVQPSISNQGSNSSILVSWTTPPGKVENYKVYLNNISTALEEVELDSKNTSFLFEDVSAGRLYTAVVTTFSGPFNASSGVVKNATFPNSPGTIDIPKKTTGSIDIRWMEAPLMTGASFYYQLTNQSPQRRESINTTNTCHTFDFLLSGTSYNISIATVGPMGFESEKIQINMVTTRPFSVKSLTASTEEEKITVMWAVPDEYKESYHYNVTLQSSDGFISDRIIKENEFNIDDLFPGKRYNISVTTETSDGTKGAPTWISRCTDASPVKDLKCEGPNTKDAEIILNWNIPKGQYSGFNVTVNNDQINSPRTCCQYTVSDLRHYTEYNLTMETQSCGQPSTPVHRRCTTGITNPPIPENFETLVVVSTMVYNKFILQIDSRLLNSTNGPITHVGVLVTNNPPDETSDWTKYVGKTYNQWRKKDTPVYLATVTKRLSQSRSGANDLTIEVGDESKWNGYTNGALDANGKYQYAIVLFTSLTLKNNLVDEAASLVSTTNFYRVFSLPQNPAIIGIAIGVTFGIFCVLFIILIGFIIYWKRLSTKDSSDIQIHSMRAKVSVAMRVEDYEAYYKKQKADSDCGFAEEFEDLKIVGTAQLKTNAVTLENKPKNRYSNVLPYDSSRVKLSIIHGSPYGDYINANCMPGYNSRKEYIAAQGPLASTVSDFWRMIWEQNVQTLVMLTRCNEQGRVKCEQYWNNGTKHFENITVTTTSEISLEDWTIRDFDIKNVKTAETRSVRQFHFTVWPDHGVPQTTELLIGFRHLVREHMNQYSRHSPTVVHCSAGVGRTGTFIAIDSLIFQIERENIVDVYGIVHDLRMHRPLMVQTEDQYVFLNQCAIDIIRSRTGTNVDLIYQNTAALSIYENVEPKKGYPKKGYHNA
ncbi:receptor-type tyrosine-protein phosphatase eta-like isoform X3 [Cottoperca gobio]|uniref:protein-tyrosine-phosphatase n=1 Tax=Cottoperca gobio TaxID=56716 RepID=A0A6J2PYR9_COTGO|nr:receptor-type tyrosine-protein phosphatase eta-like isoform X3 [Cottoperca gobio]